MPVSMKKTTEEKQEDKTESPKYLEVPVFISRSDVNRWTYENNLMLKELLSIIREELKEAEHLE